MNTFACIANSGRPMQRARQLSLRWRGQRRKGEGGGGGMQRGMKENGGKQDVNEKKGRKEMGVKRKSSRQM